MALPILETQSYDLTLPSADVKIKFRPFLVKEEKVLLQALESEDQKQIVNALKEIVSACTFGTLVVDDLPTFDLEYIFLNIRAKSVGEVAKLNVLCPDDKKTYTGIEVDLTKIEVQVDDSHTNNIVIDENKKIGIIMKYPTLGSVDPSMDFTKEQTNKIFQLISNSIYQIYEGDKIYNTTDYTKEELNKFIESLSTKAFGDIQNFYNTMPKLIHEVEIENPKTKVKSKVTLQGLTDFFG
jgi:citrate lyase gamma subunit